MYLLASFAKYITSVYYSIKNFLNYQLYVSVEIDDMERVYRPIAAFISEQMESVALKVAQGEYDRRSSNHGSYTRQDGTNPSIALQPGKLPSLFLKKRKCTFCCILIGFLRLVLDHEHRFVYNGQAFWAIRLSEQQSGNVSSSGGAWSRLFGGLQKSSIRITMRGRDIKKLRRYMQEWIDLYYSKKDNKVIINLSCVTAQQDTTI